MGWKSINIIFAHQGEMAEWSNAAVLKTVEGHTSGGSTPSFSANYLVSPYKHLGFVFFSVRYMSF